MNNKDTKEISGITLIALVVTIVVLIILATVSINMVLGDNGIIKKAQFAKEMQANSVIEEAEAMNRLYDEYANMMVEPPETIDPETGWDLTKVIKVTSEDNKVVPVPIGYTASTITGEKSVSTGFVIKEGDNGGATSGINEFIWVPVNSINDIYDSENNVGQLWDFSETTSTKKAYSLTSYHEPDVVTGDGNSYDAVSDNLQQAGLLSTATASDFKAQLQAEFEEMIDSVEKYGGFYIGRYETGNLSQNTAVVQKGNKDIDGQTWYTHYKLSKTIAANSNVVSSMIWGCQWDATMRWLQTSETERVKNFPKCSTTGSDYGNFSNNSITYVEEGTTKTTTIGGVSIIPTGSADITNVNNIYDMAGNVGEWTLEFYSSTLRSIRCPASSADSAASPPGEREDDYSIASTSEASYIGSRSSLFIALTR